MNDLCVVKPIDGLGQRIVVAVANATDRVGWEPSAGIVRRWP